MGYGSKIPVTPEEDEYFEELVEDDESPRPTPVQTALDRRG